MNSRIKKLREKIINMNLEGIIISNPVNIKYLTNIDAEGILLITKKENIYITDARYVEAVQSIITLDDEILINDIADVDQEDFEGFFMFCENVGFEENYVTYAQYKKIMRKYKINNLEETDKIVEKQRIIKDDEEIETISKACEITDRCFNHLLDFIKIGMTEKQVAREINNFFMDNGASDLAFETIVASGANASKPHAVPTDKKIEYGDVILIDMGCKYDGYCSDMTRTIFAGTIKDEIKEVYDLVLKIQLEVERQLADGVNLKLLSKMVQSDFKLNGYDLIHALGHGVGLDIHELPVLSWRNDCMAKSNMIVTNEPGIYLPNKFGIRIEDTLLVTKTGCIRLTKSSKGYQIIDEKR